MKKQSPPIPPAGNKGVSAKEAQRRAFLLERQRFMEAALEQARMAYACDEVPVGAVLVRDGQIVAAGHNRCLQLHDPTAHAEMLCIRQGAEKLKGRLTDCTLYVTLEPCAMCIGAAINAKLGRLVFGAFDERAGCCGSVLDLSDRCFLYSVEVWGGILEKDCASLLTEFFAKKR